MDFMKIVKIIIFYAAVVSVLLIIGYMLKAIQKKYKKEIKIILMRISDIRINKISRKINSIFNKDSNHLNEYLDDWDKIKSPLMIGYLYEEKLSYRHLIATLLNFIDKKYIEVIPIKENNKIISYKLKKKDLEIYKPKVYYKLDELTYENIYRKNLVKYKVSVSDIYTINRIIFNDNREVSVDEINKFYDDEDCEGKETDELLAKMIYLKKIINKELEIYGIMKTTSSENKLTKIGIRKQQEWIRFADKLKKWTLMENKDLDSFVVWGKFLTYGIALNVCKIAIEDIRNIYYNIYL